MYTCTMYIICVCVTHNFYKRRRACHVRCASRYRIGSRGCAAIYIYNTNIMFYCQVVLIYILCRISLPTFALSTEPPEGSDPPWRESDSLNDGQWSTAAVTRSRLSPGGVRLFQRLSWKRETEQTEIEYSYTHVDSLSLLPSF